MERNDLFPLPADKTPTCDLIEIASHEGRGGTTVRHLGGDGHEYICLRIGETEHWQALRLEED